MPKHEISETSRIYNEWRKVNKPSSETQFAIGRWSNLIHMASRASWPIEEGLEWFNDRSKPEPDFFATVAWYGRFRLYLPYWKLPIELTKEEYDQWRTAGWLMTERDFIEDQASNVGGFLELAGRDPKLFASILQRQVDERFGRLEELASLPLEEYTPYDWDEEERMEGDGPMLERREFDRPFIIREDLQCFSWGFEKLRMFAMSEQNPDVNLPNMELFGALRAIDLNLMLARLHRGDEQLKKILSHLVKHRYNQMDLLDDPYAPKIFWWRHWGEHVKEQRQKRHERDGRNSH